MSALECLTEILKLHKYYEHAKPKRYNPSTAFRIVEAIKEGTCKPETERAFLAAYGYAVISPIQYTK